VSEEFALQDPFRQGPAVDGHKEFLPAVTSVVDGLGYELFSRSRFPRKKYITVPLRHFLNHLKDPIQCQAVPDHAFGRPLALKVTAKQDVLRLQTAALGGPLDDHPHFVGGERLGQVVIGPFLDGLDSTLNGGVSGDHNDHQGGLNLLQLLQKLDTIHAGHPDIADDNIEMLLLYAL
jgi:hypothetical protein